MLMDVLLVLLEILIPVFSARIPRRRSKTESVSVLKDLLCSTQECAAATAKHATRHSAARLVRVLGSAFNASINIGLT